MTRRTFISGNQRIASMLQRPDIAAAVAQLEADAEHEAALDSGDFHAYVQDRRTDSL